MRPILALALLLSFPASAQSPTWQAKLAQRLPSYGHRNWVVIADSAYPDQARPGIETIVVHEDQVQVLRKVLAAIKTQKHIRPIVHTDSELKFVNDKDAPGVAAYRETLAAIFKDTQVDFLPHEKIISMLDEAAQTFRVLIIKTNMTIPYTSVFLQLDCAYWGADSEKKLRAAMAAATQ